MKTNYNTYFFFALLIGLAVLAFFMMRDFLIPFLMALILVHLFNPVYRKILQKTGQKKLSSILTCLLVAFIIIIPVLILLVLTINEVQAAIASLTGNSNWFEKIVFSLDKLASVAFFKSLGFEKIANQDSVLAFLKNFSQSFLFILQSAYAGILRLLFATFIMFFSLFYMFIDGNVFLKRIIRLIPLQAKYEKSLLRNLNSMIRATIKGTLVMAVLQGLIGSLVFWATGVSSPLFFGILMAIFSVIPPVGSGLVWLPVAIIMIVSGHVAAGISIVAMGILVIGTMDNFLRARLVGNDTQMHPLLILFSTLGGIAYFGIAGFIIGPIIASILVALLDIYLLEFKSQ